jgi:hypothetical protein
MGRKTSAGQVIIFLLILVVIKYILEGAQYIITNGYPLLIAIASICIIVFIAKKVIVLINNYEAKKSMDNKVTSEVESHINTLVRKRLQTVQMDDYGIVKKEKWESEINYFINKLIIPKLDSLELQALLSNIFAIKEFIEQRTQEASLKQEKKISYSDFVPRH